ncbi:DUF2922 domain-containing protein [uncultured Clostridium sp.]|uniref:DUF2922 domain-containing protein n=1 Tax=uncultured Clostridium sp. TaxID=59620 RepID=UPI00260ACB6B|nr:DUF2922 domain-containing protein [uncultured Clostridium sp.]
MFEKVLVMTFTNGTGKKFSLKLKDLVEDLDQVALVEIMDTIIENEIFTVGDYPLIEKVKCELIATETTPFKVA